MTEQDQQAYSQLIDVYKRQKAEFNEWKTANSRQSGTQEYLDYCNRFKLWEKDVKKQMAEYEAKLGRPTAGPVGPETILNDLLRKVDEMQFLMSIIQMSSQDKTFLPALLDANKKLQAQQPSFSGAPVAYTPTPIHVPSAPYAAMMPFASVPAAFGSPQIMPISVAPSPMPYAFASPVIPGVGNAPITVVTASTIPPYSAPIAANTPKPPQGTPVLSTSFSGPSPSTSTVYRPPSPVRDYKVVQLPFQDFSIK